MPLPRFLCRPASPRIKADLAALTGKKQHVLIQVACEARGAAHSPWLVRARGRSVWCLQALCH